MLTNLIITDNEGTIELEEKYDIKDVDLKLESAFIHCSNQFGIGEECYVKLSIKKADHLIHNSNKVFTFVFPPPNVASNVLYINHQIDLGETYNDGLSEIDYKVYDHTFGLLAGNIKLVIQLTF